MGAKKRVTKAKSIIEQTVAANAQVPVAQYKKSKPVSAQQDSKPQPSKVLNAQPSKVLNAQPSNESDGLNKTIVSLNKGQAASQISSSGKIQFTKQEKVSKITLPQPEQSSSIKTVKLVAPSTEKARLASWNPEQYKSGLVISLNQDRNSIARNLLNIADQKTLFPDKEQNEESKAEKSILEYNAKDRKQLRLARFNCENPTAVNTDAAQEIKKTNEDKIKKRHERFGTQLSTNEKKVDRMMRFGIPVKEEEDKKKEARMKKFGLMRSDQDQVKKLQRMERFNALEKLQLQVRPESELARKREVAL